jgi:excisionase family DNA binding protein
MKNKTSIPTFGTRDGKKSRSSKQARVMTTAELLELPTMVGLSTAARALRIGRSTAFELVRRGEFPVPVHRIGKSWRVSTAQLLGFLGVAMPDPSRPELPG